MAYDKYDVTPWLRKGIKQEKLKFCICKCIPMQPASEDALKSLEHKANKKHIWLIDSALSNSRKYWTSHHDTMWKYNAHVSLNYPFTCDQQAYLTSENML